MIFRTPSYYSKFKCIASRCTDNCCIGWEIDIDRISRERYERVSGSFGERLREAVVTQEDGSCSFRLLEKGRCAFLNKDNLCDLILELGENSLCQICRDHPRYFEWFDGGIKEGGIGLCCEEAARIILSSEEPFRVTETGIEEEENEIEEEKNEIEEEETDTGADAEVEASEVTDRDTDTENNDGSDSEDGYDSVVFGLRQECLEILDRKDSLSVKLSRILKMACERQADYDAALAEAQGEEAPDADFSPEEVQRLICDKSVQNRVLASVCDLLSPFEPMDPAWPRFLKEFSGRLFAPSAETNPTVSEGNPSEGYLKNVAQYFFWRYTGKGVFEEDGFFLPYFLVPVILTLFVQALFEDHQRTGGAMNLSEAVKIVKNVSKEVEYDEEIVEQMLCEICGIIRDALDA